MANYVKFYRGTQAKYDAAIKQKQVNDDTLYFITDAGLNKGALYLGDMLISKDITDFSEIPGLNISNTLKHKDLLVYDAFEEAWINKSILEAIGIFVGAKEGKAGSNGLVPAPIENGENLFLRGDGTWAKIPVSDGIALVADEKSVSIIDKTIALKDFGVKYYKFIAESGSLESGDFVASHYESQLVDATHPWSANLEPKVVEENGELVLGWFEPNTEAIDKLNSKVTILEDSVKTLNIEITSVKNLASVLNTQKANISDVYTKSETDTKISEAVVSAQHLKRKTFATLEEARVFATSITNADEYIFMVSNTSTGENKYDEYLFVEGELEKVGAWDVDLTDYATKEELRAGLDIKVEKRDGFSLISLEDLNKLSTISEGAEVNKIDSVDEIEFNLTNRHLSLNAVPISKISNLEAILNQKVEKSVVEEIKIKIETTDNKINNLEKLLNSSSFVTKDELLDELAPLENAVTWGFL